MLPVFIYVKISRCNMVRAFIKQKLRTRRKWKFNWTCWKCELDLLETRFPPQMAYFRHFPAFLRLSKIYNKIFNKKDFYNKKVQFTRDYTG